MSAMISNTVGTSAFSVSRPHWSGLPMFWSTTAAHQPLSCTASP